MPRTEKDETREERIIMEIIVDAYGPEEQAMGWDYYLEDNLSFPFKARCTKERSISPRGALGCPVYTFLQTSSLSN